MPIDPSPRNAHVAPGSGPTSATNSVEGSIRLAMPLTCQYLLPVLTQFQQEHPGVRLDIYFDNRKSRVRDSEFDAVFRTGDILEDGLVGYELDSFGLVVVGAPRYFERRGRPVRCADLAQHTCIHYRMPESGELMPWPLVPAAGDYVPNLDLHVTSNNNDARLAFLLGGVGLSCMPDFLVAELLHEGALEAVLQPFLQRRFTYRFLWSPASTLTPALQALASFVARYFGVGEHGSEQFSAAGTKTPGYR